MQRLKRTPQRLGNLPRGKVHGQEQMFFFGPLKTFVPTLYLDTAEGSV